MTENEVNVLINNATSGLATNSSVKTVSNNLSDLETGLNNGTTTISGGCISTGTIAAKYINVDDLKVKHFESANGTVTDLSVSDSFTANCSSILSSSGNSVAVSKNSSEMVSNGGAAVKVEDGIIYIRIPDSDLMEANEYIGLDSYIRAMVSKYYSEMNYSDTKTTYKYAIKLSNGTIVEPGVYGANVSISDGGSISFTTQRKTCTTTTTVVNGGTPTINQDCGSYSSYSNSISSVYTPERFSFLEI